MATVNHSPHKADDPVKELLEVDKVFPSQDNMAALLDYKNFTIEMAGQIAPDLQETVILMLQASLGKLQQEVQMFPI